MFRSKLRGNKHRYRPGFEVLEDRCLMSVAAFLLVNGIPGEATDTRHAGWIEVDSWSLGQTNTGTTKGTGAAAGKTTLQDLHVVTPVDKAAPKLMQGCIQGKAISEITLAEDHPGATADFLVVTFKNVYVSAIQIQGGSQELPMEEVTFAYSALTETYQPQNADGVASGQPVVVSIRGKAQVTANAPAALLGQTSPVPVSTLTFLYVPGIPGESTDAQHPNWIEVESWSWGVTNWSAPAGVRAGKAHFDSFHVVAQVDKSSPLLLKASLQDEHLKDVILAVGRPGAAGANDFLTYTMSKAIVGSFQITDVNDAVPAEEITFTYGGLAVAYQPQGGSGAPMMNLPISC